MKKIGFIITFLVIIASGITTRLTAQEKMGNMRTKAKFGVKGGVNISNLYTKEVNDENSLIGFNLGLFAKLPVNSMFAIQPEIYYTTKGAKNTYNNLFANGSVKYTFNYVEVPILAVINITKNFNIHGGPYVAYWLSGKVKNESNVTLFNFEDDITTDDYNKIDAGFAAGVGVDVGGASVGLRYNYGLTKVGKERTYGTTTYTFPDGKNSVLSLNVCISLY